MNIFIDDILCSTVEFYMEQQWVNKHREVSFYRAREELLSHAWIYFYEPDSTIVVNIYREAREGSPEMIMPNPVIASSQGIFPDLAIEDGFRMVIVNSDDYVLSTSEVANDD